MASYVSYSPVSAIERALFNFDEFGWANYRLLGTVRVSTSDSFSYADFLSAYYSDFQAALYSSPQYFSEFDWSPERTANLQDILHIYSQFANITFAWQGDYDLIGVDTTTNPEDVGRLNVADINITWLYRPDVPFSGISGASSDGQIHGYVGGAGDIFLNGATPDFAGDFSLGVNSTARQTLMHELGHSLGLSHPHTDYANGIPTISADFADTVYLGFQQLGFGIASASDMYKEYFTIMSYDDEVSLLPGSSLVWHAHTPMILDVIALQGAYGEGPGTSGSGNDTIEPGTAGYRTYFDTGGTDTIDAVNYTQGTYLHMGVTIVGAPHLVGIGMSVEDGMQTILAGGDPAHLRWFYGEYEHARGSLAADVIVGNTLANSIGGMDGNDLIAGAAGNDSLEGGIGNDELDGGEGDDWFDWGVDSRAGADTFYGGLGNDVFVLDSVADTVIELVDEGVDTIWVFTSYSLEQLLFIEELAFGGDLAGSLIGNAADNMLYGNVADNTLAGGAGNDTLQGGDGNDALNGGAGGDYIDGGLGADTAAFAGNRSSYLVQWNAASQSFTVTSGTEGGDTVVNVESFQFADGSLTANVLMDTTIPTVTSLTPADEATGIAAGANVVVTFSEPIQRGTGNIILKTSGGTVVATYDAATSANLSVSGSTLTIDPSADLGYSTGYVVEFAADSIKDLAGNSYAGTTTYNFTTAAAPDLTAPTVEISDNSPGTAVGDVTYTLTFSETVTGLATDDFGVTNGTVASVSGSGSVYSVVVTPTAGFEGNLSLTLLAGAVADLAGNLSAASAAPAQPIDTKAPTVSITDNLAGVANTSTANVVYTLTFSEPVLGLDGSDFIASNIAGGTVSGSGTTWTVTLTPKAGVSSGTIGLALKANAVTDAAGNPNAAASNTSQAIDTAAPVAPKLVTGSAFYSLVDPQVTFHTTLGDVVMELNPAQAPVTVANMLAYVDTGFYSGTLFHRVIPNFMAQGGGFSSGMVYKTPTYDPIVLESNNGLLNLRGTVAMARTPAPDSATSQFFVNLVDNAFLDYSSAANPGYAVFGRVVAGMSVIDSMALIPTGTIVPHANVPQTEIVISSAQQTVAGSSTTNSAVFQVQGLESSATWEYSLDGGTTWFAGSGNSIALSAGSYAANAIQVRQTDAAGNLSTGVGHYGSALVIDTIAPGVSTFAPSDDAANVDIASNIALVFNESVRRGTGSIVLKAADGTVVATYDAATSANLSFLGNTLTINPSADLDYGTGYVVEFAAGSIKDLAGNSYAGTTTYNFTTSAQPMTGQAITGGIGPDSLVGTVGNDTVAGGAGIDIYTFTGNRSQYILTKTANGYQAHDGTPGRDGTDLISAVETLAFADSTVDLTMAQRAAAIPSADLKTLEELYVGFFNRIPEAAGLRYWIGEVESGVSLRAVADQFYSAGVQFGVYSESMTEAEFILAIYANVLGRSGATAPPQEDIEYWQGWLHTGTNSKGAMVLEMLSNSHEFFTGDPEVGWVIDLLDNKAEVANYFAVQQGLSYSDPLTNIARGIEIAAEITPTDTSAAIALIGVNEFSM